MTKPVLDATGNRNHWLRPVSSPVVLLQEISRDIRYGLRSLARNRGFTVVALLTLALGIGASTAIFTVLDGVLLKPLPYPDPDRLVVLYESSKEDPEISVSYPAYLDWLADQNVFDAMAAYMPAGGVLTGGEPERVIGRWVTASFFQTLGVQPEVGRAFTDSEDRAGAARVMVLGYNLWRRRFSGDPNVIGRVIQYNAESWTVVGVMPGRFDFYGRNNIENDFFIPLGLQAEQEWMHHRQSHSLAVIARMKPAVMPGRARIEMSVIAQRLALQYPESEAGNQLELHSLTEDYVGDSRPALLVIWAAVMIVLLIACANVAGLQLARANGRQREIAVRIAIGAGRWRLIRQLLTESALLSMGGAIVGLIIALWSIDFLARLNPDSLPRLEDVTVDLRSLAYAVLAALLSTIVSGLVPAIQSATVDPHDALKEGARSSMGAGRRRFRSGLVIAQIAMSAALLVGAGLLLKSFWRLSSVDSGFDPQNVLTLRLRLPDAKYRDGRQTTGFLNEVLRRVVGLPGVTGASVATGFPTGRVHGRIGYFVDGQPEPQANTDWPEATNQAVSEGYHEALGIRLLAGRLFTPLDTADAPPVVIVDDHLAGREFPGGSPADAIGKRLRFKGDAEPWREIVGVTGHVRQYDPAEEEGPPGIYMPWLQIDPKWLAEYTRAMDLIIKSSVDPASLIPDIKREVQLVDKDEPLGNVRTLSAAVARAVAPRKLSSELMGLFALAALMVSAVGLYGQISYSVAGRTQEIGIRMAVGAGRREVLRLVVSEGVKLAVAGAAIGLLAALALSGFIENQLFGIRPTDPSTLASATGLIIGVALAATYFPARRATKVDVAAALRAE
jgi:putative ABC transport system permease protein